MVLRNGIRVIVWASVGALIAYFFDPDRGRGRRIKARDMIAARLRRAGRLLGRRARYAEGVVDGAVARLRGGPAEPADDWLLEERVRTELLSDADVPKGRITVDVENGVVILRGEIDDPAQAGRIERRAREIPGVGAVRSLLHPAGTPAPNKAAALDAGGGARGSNA
jgi:BON domain-containing protein